MSSAWMLVVVAWAAMPPTAEAQNAKATAPPRAVASLVSIKDEVQVPALEPGVLAALDVQEGTSVRRGQIIGHLDNAERQLQRRLALVEQQSAKQKADTDIDVRYARSAADVARAEYDQAVDANRRVNGTFPLPELRRLKLAAHKAELSIEKSEFDRQVASLLFETRSGELALAEQHVEQRQLTSPIDGEVVEVLKRPGEWVDPGQSVLRIVRFDTLIVEGFYSVAEFDPADLAGRAVQVEVQLARGRVAQFDGRIVYVSPLVQAGGQFQARAEVENRLEQGHWLLRPGMTATVAMAPESTPVGARQASVELKPQTEQTPAQVEPVRSKTVPMQSKFGATRAKGEFR